MIDFRKNPNTNDIEMDGQNDIAMATEDDELMQCVRDVLTTNLGEWFLNPEGHGFARFRVLGQKFDQEQATSELIAAILQEPRIASVERIEWDFDRETRQLTGTFELTKQNGDVLQGGF